VQIASVALSDCISVFYVPMSDALFTNSAFLVLTLLATLFFQQRPMGYMAM
jgi:hypothetical protein